MDKFFNRRRNKTFYMTFVAQLLITIQLVAELMGYNILDTVMQNKILMAVDAVLVLAAHLGLVNDPTTPGLSDKE